MAKEQSTNVWLPSVVLATLAAISYLAHETVYQSSRPAESQSWSRKLEDAQHVEARLWQDPFFAVDQHIRAENGAKDKRHHDLKGFLKRIKEEDSAGSRGLTVMTVMVPNAPYAEQAERRRRIRYAVLSGLSRSALVPEDQEHIGYFEPNPGTPLPNVVPYEMFERNASGTRWRGPRKVLLLWLATDASETCPIRRVASLFHAVAGGSPAASKDWSYVVLGPHDSGTLAEMFVEAASDQCETTAPIKDMIRQLKIYSPFASAAGRELAYSVKGRLDERRVQTMYPGSNPDWRKLIQPCLQEIEAPLQEQLHAGDCDIEAVIQKRVNFVRLIADDTLLAGALFNELKLRGIDPVCEAMERLPAAGARPDCFDGALDRHRIAIVSEWDTPYQRSLRRTLKRVMGERCADQYPVHDCEALLDARWIVPFSYMRGVDGQVAGDAAKPKEEKRPGAESSAQAGPKDSLERADGNRQFDYLRRLAERIARKDAELEAAGESGIGAVAVLGSDPYDKLTILQALHEELPDKVFVTSNLDARLLHPDEFKWARNLVVISPFGLELHNDLQSDIPPLRDGYQTAAFFATQIAVKGYDFAQAGPYMRDQRSQALAFLSKPCNDNAAVGTLVPWLAPQVFEVGRTGAIRLERCPIPQRVEAPTAACPTRWDFTCLHVHPPSRAIFATVTDRARMPISVVVGLVVAALILILWPGPKPTSADRDRNGSNPGPANAYGATRKVVVAVASLVVSACIAYAWNDIWQWLTAAGAGEPAFIFEGVSMWPAQIIRGAALILALAFLTHAHRSLTRNAREIAEDFAMERGDAQTAAPKPESCLRQVYRTFKTGLLDAWHWVSAALRMRPPHSNDQQQPQHTSVQTLDAWAHYCREAAACPRFVRVLAWTGAYTIISFCLVRIWPVIAPFRGTLSFAVNGWIVTLCILAFNLLLFYVFDALSICKRCVARLAHSPPHWSKKTYARFISDAAMSDQQGLTQAHLDQWIAVHMIGQRTQAVGTLIYWPFILLFLIILARNSVFEYWNLVPSVTAYWAMSAALLIYAAVTLRRTTERVREKAIDSLSASLLAAKGSENQRLAGQLQWMIDALRLFNKGAFASYADQHFIRALLLPLAGIAGSLLMNYLSLVKA